MKPDLAAFEVKTPVVKYIWGVVDDIKSINSSIKVVLFGDHVTALPLEYFLKIANKDRERKVEIGFKRRF